MPSDCSGPRDVSSFALCQSCLALLSSGLVLLLAALTRTSMCHWACFASLAIVSRMHKVPAEKGLALACMEVRKGRADGTSVDSG